MRRKTGLTEGGWGVLVLAVALAVSGVRMELNLLILLFSAMISTLVISTVAARRATGGVRLKRSLPGDITAGEPFFAQVFVRRPASRLPRWGTLFVREKIASPSGEEIKRSAFIPNMPAAGEADGGYELAVPERGRYRFGASRVASRFPFSLAHSSAELHVEHSFIAYPRRGRLLRRPDPPIRRAIAPAAAARMIPEPVGEFHSLREFRHGDNPHLIHWRSSAKRNELLLRKLDEPLSIGGVAMIVDSYMPDDGPEARDRFEMGVSFAATLAEYFAGQGFNVALYTPEDITGPTGRTRSLLSRLAVLETSGDAGSLRRAADLLTQRRESSWVVAVSMNGKARAILRAMLPDAEITAYSPDGRDFESVFRPIPAKAEGNR